MKKGIVFFVFLILLFSTSCGNKQGTTETKEMKGTYILTHNDELDSIELAKQELGIDLITQEEQYVLNLDPLFMCYSIEENSICGLTVYVVYESNIFARQACEEYRRNPDAGVENIKIDGRWVIITFDETAWEGLSIDDLESLNEIQ